MEKKGGKKRSPRERLEEATGFTVGKLEAFLSSSNGHKQIDLSLF